MTGEEVKDLFIATHQIVSAIERHYHGMATNIAIQDGKEAGPECRSEYLNFCISDIYLLAAYRP